MTGPDRALLADSALAAGPGAPTLCEGWDVRDLLVHLVVREGRPDAALGRAAGALGGPAGRLRAHAEHVEASLRELPFALLVDRFRAGPPRWSPLALPGVEGAANGVELYVHRQDVRRAQPGWDPADVEELPAGRREELWRSLRRAARLLYRRSPVGVVLVVPAGPRTVAARGEESVVVTGRPEELLLHAFGRRGAAQVDVTGSPSALAAFAGAELRV